jgi:hypothetical protein
VTNFFTPGTDYQFVLRLTRSDAGVDSSALWVNPASEADAPLRAVTNNYLNSGTTTPFSIIIAPQAGTFSYDNIRLGTAFGQVVPEPGTTVLILVAGGICAGGFRRHRGRAAKNEWV